MFDSSLWILHPEPEPSFRLNQTYRPFQSQPAFGDRFVQVTAPLIVWHHARYSIGFASGIRSKLGGVSGNVGKMSLCNMGSALLRHSAKLAILHGGWKDSAVVDCCIFVSAQFASLFRFFFFLGWIFPCENLYMFLFSTVVVSSTPTSRMAYSRSRKDCEQNINKLGDLNVSVSFGFLLIH